MSRALRVPDVEVRLMRQLLDDRKRAKLHVERVGLDVVETYVVPVSNDALGLAIWLSSRTGEDAMHVIDRLGAELDELTEVPT